MYDKKELNELKESYKQLYQENDKLHETIKDMQRPKETIDCVSMNYEAAYRSLQFECQHISDENESLKKALVALALKL